ncbi:MAG: hypothetical protein IJ461_06570 [Clostridia bacterium]|nr:hypothetical protein [Clostridia bacterium]
MRRFLLVLGIILLLIQLLALWGSISSIISDYQEQDQEEIAISFDYYDVDDVYYQTVYTILQDCGFTNIELMPTSIIDGTHSDGAILEMTVNGDTRYFDDDRYPANAIIRILYYSTSQ